MWKKYYGRLSQPDLRNDVKRACRESRTLHKHDNELKNAEGYPDPTAYKAIKRADDDFERYQKVLGCLLRVCELSDFKIDGRITLVDKRTGKVWE